MTDHVARPGPRRAVALLAGAVLAAAGGAGFASVLDAADLAPTLGVAAILGASLSTGLTGVARRRAAVVWAVVAAALPLVAGLAARAGPAALLEGLRDGPMRLLTTTVPADADPAVLVVPAALTFLSSVAAAEALQRARNRLAPLVAPLAALLAGLAFGADGSAPPSVVVLVWLCAAGVVLVLGTPAPVTPARAAAPGGAGGPGTRRAAGAERFRIVLAVPTLAVVVLGATLLGPRLPLVEARDRFELRAHVDHSPDLSDLRNPLAEVTGHQSRADHEVLFSVTADLPDDADPVDRWRTAVLDRYDGVEWRTDAELVSAGRRLPTPPGGHDAGTGPRIVQRYEQVAQGGGFLPALPVAVELDAEGVVVDPATGVLLAPGDAPEAYEVVSTPPRSAAGDLLSAPAASDAEAEAARQLPPEVPAELVDLVDEVVAGTDSPYGQAAAIARHLTVGDDDGFQLAVDEPPTGHSLGHLVCFLARPDRCARTGSTEQFVAAFAVLARVAGVPTRVVVGYDAALDGSGRDEVTTDRATAWAEIKLEGLGWVTFDPVPDADAELVPPPEEVAGDEQPPPVEPPGDIGERPDDTDDAAGGATDDGRRPGAVALLAVAALVVLAALVAPALLRWRRRVRRRAGPAPARIAGAWAQALDELALAGAPALGSRSVGEVVRAGRGHLGPVAEPLGPLGALVNRTRYDRAVPGDDVADAAWQMVADLVAGRRRGRTRLQRAREHLSLRDLRARR